jgi:hypothetical protein
VATQPAISSSHASATYRPNTLLGWIGRSVVLLEIVFGCALLAAAPGADGTQAWIYSAGGMLLGGGLLTLGLAFPSWRVTRINSTELRIPAGLHAWKTIRLSEITGVGLVFYPGVTGARTPMEWVACVWADGVGRIPIKSLSYVPVVTRASSEPGNRWSLTKNPWDIDPFAVTDIATALKSTAGKATVDIYRRVAASQGSNGRLVTQHTERHDTFSIWDMPLSIAYCSPDGDYARYERRDPPSARWDDDE